MNFMDRSDQLLKALINHRKAIKKVIANLSDLSAVLIILITLSSCSLLSGNIKTSRESDEESSKLIQETGIIINSITVHKSFDSETVRKNALYAFDILIPPVKNGLKTDVVLKEEAFVKGFEQLNTVSLELVIKDRNEKSVKLILVSEESENTLSSYKYLYKILEKGINETGL